LAKRRVCFQITKAAFRSVSRAPIGISGVSKAVLAANISQQQRKLAMVDSATARARLEAQLVELKGRQDRIAQDLATPLNPDLSEQAVEMEDDASLEGQAALTAREIASVQRALTRIKNGTYGECVRCGEQIAAKRLEARPEAALCIKCARKEQ
jgi:DnaK suppressor protein